MYFPSMNIEQAKSIPLEELLLRLGYTPSRRNRDQLWYLSPLRTESTPSFKVNTAMNAWYDFGAAEGGDIIDLVKKLDGLGNVSATLARIEELVGSAPLPLCSPKASLSTESSASMELTHVGPVQAKSLQTYLRSRGIDPKAVGSYVQQAHYHRGGDKYFALAFANDKGGYELRNPNFKGTLGTKNITMLKGDPNWVLVFEGLFDFLSLIMLEGRKPDATVIVLNSVSKRESAVEAIRKLNPKLVELYPDHDVAGRELVEYFKSGLPNSDVIDKSAFYEGYDDLNDWYANRGTSKYVGSSRS